MQNTSIMKSLFSAVFIFTLALGFSAQAGTVLKLNSGLIQTSSQQGVVNLKFNSGPILDTHSEWIVQFESPITEAEKSVLKKKGFKIISYIPDDALLVTGDGVRLAELVLKDSFPKNQVRAVEPFRAEMKLSPLFGKMAKATLNQNGSYLVSVYDASRALVVAQKIQAQSPQALIQKISGQHIVVSAAKSEILNWAAFSDVEHIQPLAEIQPLHINLESTEDSAASLVDPVPPRGDYTDLNGYETGTKIMNFDAAWSRGLTGAGEVVGMADTGLDSGNALSIHRDFMGSVKSGYAVGMFGKTWADPMGHGTHVAGSVLGKGTAAGGALKGGAYSAQMVAQGMWSPVLNNLSVPSNLAGMFGQAYTDGARVHTNSWGAAANFGAYEKMAATVDQVMFEKQDMLILFAAGNSGVDKDRNGRIDPNSVGTPGTSKNALTVGASENLLFIGGIQKKVGELKTSPESWPVAPITESMLSDDPNGIAMFSSRGPTADGRMKPDIVAPGTNILSVKSQQAGAQLLWGAYNTDYVYSGGTSMACPLTAAAAVIAREHLIKNLNQPQPTAALVKAVILNSAFEMFPGQYGAGGASAGQEILQRRPNNDEGYGRVDVGQFMKYGSSMNPMLLDSKTGVATGDVFEQTMQVPASGELHVNLVWTDAPGSANAAVALVNDLDLEVVLANGTVVSNNDRINNHSFVMTAVSANSSVTIRVKAVNVPMGRNGKQPFALVAVVK